MKRIYLLDIGPSFSLVSFIFHIQAFEFFGAQEQKICLCPDVGHEISEEQEDPCHQLYLLFFLQSSNLHLQSHDKPCNCIFTVQLQAL